MANWTKKVTKAMQGELHPGEEVTTAVFLQPAGTMGQAVGKGVGGLIGKAVASKVGNASSAADDLITDSGFAERLANEPTVLALTNQRVLVMGYSTLGGKPKGLKTSMAPGDLARIDTEKQKASHKFVIHFSDGTAKLFEAPRVNNDPEGFAAAINGS